MRCAIIGCFLTLLGHGYALGAPSTPQEAARALPIVAEVSQELQGQQSAALWRYHRALLTRLLLDQGRIAATGPHALHDALLLAAVSALLDPSAEGAPEDGALRLARSAYAIHALGHAYRTGSRLKQALSDLLSRARRGQQSARFEGLKESVEGLDALGRRWFPEALQRAFESPEHHRELHLLRGLWLEREGRFSQAIDALSSAVSATATVASTIDLVRVLARHGDPKASGALAHRLGDKAPGALGTLAAVILAAADERASARFERETRAQSVAERLIQAQRYARQDKIAEAEGLINALVSSHLDAPGVFPAAAGLYLRWRRLGRLARLLEAAEALPSPPERLREARVAAVVAAHLAGVQGATAHALIVRRVDDDLAALWASPKGALRRFAVHAQLILAATRSDGEALEEASVRALRMDASPETLEVVAAAWLSQGKMTRAMSEIERALARIAPSKRPPLVLSLASLELALGAGQGSRGLIRKGLSRLDSLAPSTPHLRAQRTYLRAVGGRMSAWLGSAAPSAGGPGYSDESALRALLPLVDQVDATDPKGAVLIKAVTLSAGALGLSLGASDVAVSAFQLARRLDLSPFMEGLVVGQVALSVEDVQGGLVGFDRALGHAQTDSERFLAHKWRALAANRAGDLAASRTHFEAMLALWKGAKVAPKKVSREPVSLLLGGVEIAALMPPDGETQIQAVLTATPIFAADFPHEKRRLETLLGRKETKGSTKKTRTKRRKGRR